LFLLLLILKYNWLQTQSRGQSTYFWSLWEGKMGMRRQEREQGGGGGGHIRGEDGGDGGIQVRHHLLEC